MSKLWPYIEANKILAKAIKEDKKTVLFETGFGPSGLPHIGTFGEIARTRWVRKAFDEIAEEHGISSHLIAFSDDMDGMRKVPEGIPNRESLTSQIGLPLCRVSDPFGTSDSFASHNIEMLERFLEDFGFSDIELARASYYYQNGMFNDALKRMAEKHEEVCNVIKPTLGADRRETYSPFMPIHPVDGRVMMVKIDSINLEDWTLTWTDDGVEYVTSILDGHCKAQWKADWALRWYALGVDYEMSGKDLIDSVKLSSRICKILGGNPPLSLTYELFLDKEGKKMSKSIGNGITIDEWLRYSSRDTLSHFMFQNPQRAKKLFVDMIPKTTDEYIRNKKAFYSLSEDERNTNSFYFVGENDVELDSTDISFAMLLNLISASGTNDPAVIWEYIQKYNPDIKLDENPNLQGLVTNAFNYYNDFILPSKEYRIPTDEEKSHLMDLASRLESYTGDATDEKELQSIVFDVCREYEYNPPVNWFKLIYEVLMGQSEGPRFGVFISLYGIENTVNMIREKAQ